LQEDAADYLRLTTAGIVQFFAPDLTAEETVSIAVTHGPTKYETSYDASTADE